MEMKQQKALLLAGLLLMALPLAACKETTPGADVPSVTAAPAETMLAMETAAPQASAAPAPTEDGDAQAEAHAAYRSALTRLLNEGVLPDGSLAAQDPSADASQNQFAMCDIDGDGRDELLLTYVSAPMAGQTQYIFDYDGAAKQLRTEFSEYPLLTFYDNGVIRADWSHNQGLAGEFWPFTLYRYDAASDGYQNIGMVDAWDKNFAATGVGGAPFPAETDVSGTGIVYYIMENGVYETVEPVDASFLNDWLTARIGGAAEIPIPYAALTQAAVDAIS